MEGDGGLLGQIGQRLGERDECKWMQIGFKSGGGELGTRGGGGLLGVAHVLEP